MGGVWTILFLSASSAVWGWRDPTCAGGGRGQIALGDVPPVLLAECWRDLHDIADKGSGFDPDWQKKVY